MGTALQYCKIKNVSWMVNGDGGATVWMNLNPLNYTLKNGSDGKFDVCFPTNFEESPPKNDITDPEYKTSLSICVQERSYTKFKDVFLQGNEARTVVLEAQCAEFTPLCFLTGVLTLRDLTHSLDLVLAPSLLDPESGSGIRAAALTPFSRIGVGIP